MTGSEDAAVWIDPDTHLCQPDEIVRWLRSVSGQHEATGDEDAFDRLFPTLYYFTTKHWIDYGRSCRDPVLVELLIVQFFRLYQKYAIDHNEQAVPHWKHYLLLLRSRTSLFPFRFQVALFFGIHAHVRFDLAEAIFLVWHNYRERYRREPDLILLRSMIYGEQSDVVFRRALLGFLQAQARQNLLPERLLLILAARFERLWLPVLQKMREDAWKEAMASIRTGTPICRVANGGEGLCLA